MQSKKSGTRQSIGKESGTEKSWIDHETGPCQLQDLRLAKRFRRLLERLGPGVGGTIPLACQDWANTKGAYRFLSNGCVNEEDILAGHFQATKQRTAAVSKPILILHDTAEFSYKREAKSPIGLIGRTYTCKAKRKTDHTVRGILMHSSLAVTIKGLPLGLTAIKFWTRKRFKGCNALKRKINPTRIPIEKKEIFGG